MSSKDGPRHDSEIGSPPPAGVTCDHIVPSALDQARAVRKAHRRPGFTLLETVLILMHRAGRSSDGALGPLRL